MVIGTGFLDRCCETSGSPYQIFVPRHYTPEHRWPLTLFLHGAGEGGADGLLQTEFQLGSAIRRHGDLIESIVVFPQQKPSRCWNGADQELALRCISQTCRDYPIDLQRLSLCGVSSGAIGAWSLAARKPQRFARLLIVAGLVRPAAFVNSSGAVTPPGLHDPHEWLAKRLQHMPIWIHHGDCDPLHPVSDARRIALCLRQHNALVRYTELPGFGHNVWDAAFYSEAVLRWLQAPPMSEEP